MLPLWLLVLSIVVAVIVMKVGSRLFVNYMNRSVKVPSKNINSSFSIKEIRKGV